jgi:hypothetical protein
MWVDIDIDHPKPLRLNPCTTASGRPRTRRSACCWGRDYETTRQIDSCHLTVLPHRPYGTLQPHYMTWANFE